MWNIRYIYLRQCPWDSGHSNLNVGPRTQFWNKNNNTKRFRSPQSVIDSSITITSLWQIDGIINSIINMSSTILFIPDHLEQISDMWLESVVLGTMHHYMEKVLLIPMISQHATKQLITDIGKY